MAWRKVPRHPRTSSVVEGVNLSQGSNTLESSAIGLSLSGGGYRATLFAIGTLTALHDGGLWPNIKWIASVSGGSFANAAAAVALPADPTSADIDQLVKRTVRTTARPGTLVGWARTSQRSGFVSAAYEAGIERSWLRKTRRTLQSLRRDDRLHAFLAVDLASLKPVFMTDWIVHTVGLQDEDHVAHEPGPLPLATAVRASATFPGLPAVRITRSQLGSPFLGSMDSDLFLGDGGAWNTLATNWEAEAGWLNRRIVPIPSAIPPEVDLHIVVDASAPARRPRQWRTRRGLFALDRPLLSLDRAFQAAFQSTVTAHHLALRAPDYSMPERIALVSIGDIPHESDPRHPVTRGAPRDDWLAVSRHNLSVGTVCSTTLGVRRPSAVHLLAHGYAQAAAALATRGVPYGRFDIPHERITAALR